MAYRINKWKAINKQVLANLNTCSQSIENHIGNDTNDTEIDVDVKSNNLKLSISTSSSDYSKESDIEESCFSEGKPISDTEKRDS